MYVCKRILSSVLNLSSVTSKYICMYNGSGVSKVSVNRVNKVTMQKKKK